MSFFILRNNLQAVRVIAIRFHTTIDSKGINAPHPSGGAGGDGEHQGGGASTQRKKKVKSFYQNPIIAYKT